VTPIIIVILEVGPREQGQHLTTKKKLPSLAYFTTTTQGISKSHTNSQKKKWVGFVV
jgi:hypothetical protein